MTLGDWYAFHDTQRTKAMNEQQWLTSDNLTAMLREVMIDRPASRPLSSGRVSDRKIRLFCLACRLGNKQRGPLDGREDCGYLAIDSTDGAESAGWDVVRLSESWCSSAGDSAGDLPLALRAALLREIVGNPFRPMRLCGHDHLPDDWPFRCVSCARLRTPQVLTLALAAYDERLPDGTLDPARLAVLSDALEEAGCPSQEDSVCPSCSPYHKDTANPFGVGPGYRPERDPASGRHEGGWTNCKVCNCGGSSDCGRPGVVRANNQLLAHLRSAGPHVRGCFAIDCVLKKE